MDTQKPVAEGWRLRLHEIIYKSDTLADHADGLWHHRGATGIVTTEMAQAVRKRDQRNEACPNCGREGHDSNARFCKFCGAQS